MRVLLLGATGTIGLATARALITSGHDLVCFIRPRQDAKGGESEDRMTSDLKGSTIRYGELTDPVSIARDGLSLIHI
jgi:divinyl chlorophyllide a 8-vinyl-reductase